MALKKRTGLAPARLALLTGVLAVGLCSAPVYAATPADCAAEADRASREGGTAMRSAAGGAVRGAAFGAIVGGDSSSAGRGAAVGAVVGGARKNNQKNQTYNQVYDSCMRGYR